MKPRSARLLTSCLALWTATAVPILAQSVPEAAQTRVSPGSETPATAQHAMVVSVHHLAADAGVEVLREGGNAVDAAVATGFALAVVFPFAGNLGGGGFMLIHLKTGKNTLIDYREEAPGKATADMYLDANGNLVPGASTVGYKAIAVPGSVAGLAMAEKKYGRLGLAKAMAPAIRLATEGFTISNADEAHFYADPHLDQFAETRRIFTHDGKPLGPGDTLRQPDLARTLTRIAADPGDFYHGAMARTLAADMARGGGLITLADLEHYEPKERVPLEGSYEGLTVVAAPPPSSGGVTLLETLNILAGYNLGRLGDRTPASMHLITEAFRRAYMDRNQYLGDPDFVSMPINAMLDMKYAAAWRRSIVADAATPSSQLTRPAAFLPPAPGAPAPHEGGDTTHYSVMDAEGNAVAVTTTLNGAFGSYVTAEGLGFLLNDEMDDFTSKPGAPNMFGLVQGPANAIAPGKRPLSSMTPTIVLSGDPGNQKVRYVLGSPGGARIISTVANILLSAVDSGLNIQDAVDAPRFHHQYLPDVLYMEPGFSPAAMEGLRALGYTIDARQTHWSDGECIAVDPATGTLAGGQDHRHSFGKAAGY